MVLEQAKRDTIFRLATGFEELEAVFAKAGPKFSREIHLDIRLPKASRSPRYYHIHHVPSKPKQFSIDFSFRHGDVNEAAYTCFMVCYF